ncbi:RNA polymerase recycling motor ATPase HelR [Ruania zhangjianzhongii]|uniref:RNA polymerase recycling motor ATPase HelR n=1 Tax=Ruania zhangjianzhongii TaxID=2603206 RepID=UPI0011CB66C2|nr:RNA polymerase recycling motor ATPase HelR [Ruania zhangjianzhongii]
MTDLTTSTFDLPRDLTAKADPALIATDDAHFAAIAAHLRHTTTDLTERLAIERRAPGGGGQEAMDRDLQIHRLTARLNLLRRFSLEVCLGRMVTAGAETVYVGRIGLSDGDGNPLLIDWRSPAAAPFFGATHAQPMGLTSRRRYRWTDGRITDYWDEAFTTEGLAHGTALDDQSAFIASLGTSRTEQMRDVLGTIQADQDEIIRASSQGPLVVDGGPGTGKTVVALHRTAFLLYSDPRLGHRRGGVLFVGPHQPYLSYVADVLPSLGEEGVLTTTVRSLVPQGATATAETDPEVARLKADARMVAAVEPAVTMYEEAPIEPLRVRTPWADVWVSAQDWAEAFATPESGTPHNDAREEVWSALVDLLVDKLAEVTPAVDDDLDEDSGSLTGAPLALADPDSFDAYGLEQQDTTEHLRRTLTTHATLREAFGRAWPVLEPTDVVADLWSVPAYLRRCAPHLSRAEIAALQRPADSAWTLADLPILDAARLRLGDPEASRQRRRAQAEASAERNRLSAVMDDLIATDDSDMQVMSMLRGQDLQAALGEERRVPTDDLAGPFAHLVVDEAQELTDAEWQMLLARCPSRSLTVVGDRAQARRPFTESWAERLDRVGFGEARLATLTINYRTPQEVMAEAEPVIRGVLPDANVPTSVRSTGAGVTRGPVTDLTRVLTSWLQEHSEGIAAVIGSAAVADHPRVHHLSPELAKGLEFDLVVLVDPDSFGSGTQGAVDRYVAMTRATQQLVVLTSD